MKTANLFVHGWMGNSSWWDSQVSQFSDSYAMDLPGHGKSSAPSEYSSTVYATAIKDKAATIKADEIILIGHSMSGAYVLEASLMIPNVKKIIVVDTLKNIEQHPTIEQAEQMMFSQYRIDYENAVKNVLPNWLFTPATPVDVKERLIKEFLSVSGEKAIELLAPLYKMDLKSFAKKVTKPVIAINSDFFPNNIEINRKYFTNYELLEIHGTGHYPMLEKPEEFNQLLKKALAM